MPHLGKDTDWKRLKRHDDSMQYGILDWILEQKKIMNDKMEESRSGKNL